MRLKYARQESLPLDSRVTRMAASEDTLKSVSAIVTKCCGKDNKQFDHTFTARNTCSVPSDANVRAAALSTEQKCLEEPERAYNLTTYPATTCYFGGSITAVGRHSGDGTACQITVLTISEDDSD